MLKFESQIFILINLYHMFIIISFHYSIIIGCSKQINTHLTIQDLKKFLCPNQSVTSPHTIQVCLLQWHLHPLSWCQGRKVVSHASNQVQCLVLGTSMFPHLHQLLLITFSCKHHRTANLLDKWLEFQAVITLTLLWVPAYSPHLAVQVDQRLVRLLKKSRSRQLLLSLGQSRSQQPLNFVISKSLGLANSQNIQSWKVSVSASFFF